jgi:hypothetical protein
MSFGERTRKGQRHDLRLAREKPVHRVGDRRDRCLEGNGTLLGERRGD